MRYKFLKPSNRVIPFNSHQIQQLSIISLLAIFVSIAFLITSQNKKLVYNPNDYIILRKLERNFESLRHTQGLHFLNSTHLVESCGQYQNSEIHYINLNQLTTISQRVILDDLYQGQGVDVIDGQVYQLTWKEHMIFLRDVETLEVLENRKLNIDFQESLGISHSYKENNTLEIYITNGTDKVLILDQELVLKQIIQVRFYNGSSVDRLSEIEYVNGILYASTNLNPIILAINLTEGYVKNYYDFSQLIDFSFEKDLSNCICGIAYQPEQDIFWITGKDWPFFWEVELN
ncbi:unnamed protein product [Paramecium primaurelia]|uniref:Glutamine cyclotransferase n=1 Tax=Paramecium primaurelia TaxID=5886 RepID=A0A8S1L0J3_PARPR|nr:unnamed protein product [Paramecium primaurelia]